MLGSMLANLGVVINSWQGTTCRERPFSFKCCSCCCDTWPVDGVQEGVFLALVGFTDTGPVLLGEFVSVSAERRHALRSV